MKDGVDLFKEALRFAGVTKPELLTSKLEGIGLTELELSIIKKRYIDGLLIKQMPEFVCCGERWLKRVHAVAINKVYTRLSAKDLAELGIHLEFTSKPLCKA